VSGSTNPTNLKIADFDDRRARRRDAHPRPASDPNKSRPNNRDVGLAANVNSNAGKFIRRRSDDACELGDQAIDL
jgi:hypothetical protein